MQETAEKLRDVINSTLPHLKVLDDDKASLRAQPEKWSPKEVLGHLIDSANNNQMKFVKAMESARIDVAGYKQDYWVKNQAYQNYKWNDLINFWSLYNFHIVHIIGNVPSENLGNQIYVEGVGPFTLEFIMKDYVEHLKHHLNQILPDLGLDSDFKMVY